MKKLLILTTALCGLGVAAQAQNKEVNVVSWGGAYEKSQVEAYNIPFAKDKGIKVNMIAADNPATPLKAQVEAGNITGDVFDIEVSDAIRLCDEGALVEINPADLPAAPDGTAAADDFIPGALRECAVANIFWGTVIAFDKTKFGDNAPQTAADFFDTAKFPGKRGLPKNAKRTLYLALIADGVAPADIYATLDTPEGVDRAFAKLDTIKKDVVWWEAGAQPPQFLASGDAAVQKESNLQVVWNGGIYDFDSWAIPRGAKDGDAAKAFAAFSVQPEQQKVYSSNIAYGPANKKAVELLDPALLKDMPTTPENIANQVPMNVTFWADYGEQLEQRFNAWAAK